MHIYKRIIQFWRTELALIVILTLCLIPSSELRKIDLLKLNYEDLVVHLIMFGSFAILLFHDLQKNTTLSKAARNLSVWVISMSLLLGIFTEFLQGILVQLNRTASLTDLLFDVIGASLGIAYIRIIRRKPGSLS